MNVTNIPDTPQKRVVIAGAGFGGLKLARQLAKKNFQVVLLDKNNYHSFQPLFYQVSTAGIEPSAIAFPLRKAFQRFPNVHVRIARVLRIHSAEQLVETHIGTLHYDFLVIAIGAGNNFFGNETITKFAHPMKSIGESLGLRNTLLKNFEKALNTDDFKEQTALMNLVIVGGGPTGVELSGALSEMKRYVLPNDYPELDFNRMKIYLIEGGNKVLGAMSEKSQQKALDYLESMGVDLFLGRTVTHYDGKTVFLSDQTQLQAYTLIWAAGIKGNVVDGLNKEVIAAGNRIKVDSYNRVEGYENIFAIGDIALMTSEQYPKGHPQVAQGAIQQAKTLGKNLSRYLKKKAMKPFQYRDLGTLATIGRNKAVVDLPYFHFQGWLAWLFWMFIHLMSIVGVKNRLLIFINWAYHYFTYDQSLRLIIKPKIREGA